MLYTGKNERKPEGHDIVVNNEMPVSKPTGGQIFLWVFLCIITLGFLLLHKITVRNELSRLQNRINQSASNIDVSLQKRFDTLNKMVQAVEGHTKFNQEFYETIAGLRSGFSKASINEKQAAINKIQNGLNMNFEQYPQFIGADASIRQMMNESIMLENEISAARRLYNADVTTFNKQIYTWPTNVIIRKENYSGIPMFMASEAATKDVDISFFKD